MFRKIKKSIILLIFTIILSSVIPKITSAKEEIYTTNYDENTIHTIVEDGFSSVVYCLNNKYIWPHSLVNNEKPSYLSGYAYIENHEKYDEIIKKLEKILYAGYPYNSQNLFSIVDDVKIIVTKDDLNNYLIAPNELVLAFNEVNIDLSAFKNGSVTLDNYETYKSIIYKFYEYVILNIDDTDKLTYSIDGIQYNLTLEDIMNSNFFKTISSLIMSKDNPELYYSTCYPSYYVTEYQAYYATNYAIWKLMYDYGIEGNDISFISNYPLGQAIYNYAINSTDHILDDYNEVKPPITGDLNFTKGIDGKFYSGKFKINESTSYNGAFKLSLPNDISVIYAKTGSNVETDNNNNALLYNNNDYILVANDLPNDTDEFILQSTVLYKSKIRLYTPKENISYNGKVYQKLGGLHLYSKDVNLKFKYIDVTTGDLTVTKNVINHSNDATSTNESFKFTINLFNPNINDTYGDITFNNGIAEFILKHNETKTASSLPAGTRYEVIESETPGYIATSENSSGIITANNVKEVKFTNTKTSTSSSRASTGNLKIKKIVSGTNKDSTKPFTFTIKLSNSDINGSYGDMQFINGISTITLKHNESKTAVGLPQGTSYKVIESNNEGYIVKSKNSSGTIKNNEIAVEFENILSKSYDTSSNDITTSSIDTTNTSSTTSSFNIYTNNTSSATTSSNIYTDDTSTTDNIPITGDTSNIIIWVVLLILSVIGIMKVLDISKYINKN